MVISVKKKFVGVEKGIRKGIGQRGGGGGEDGEEEEDEKKK